MRKRDQEILDRCYKKCKGTKHQEKVAYTKACVGLAMAGAKVVVEDNRKPLTRENLDALKTNTVTRNEVMLQVKEKGVKNYRILNKAELMKVLEMKQSGATDEQITNLVIGPAKARWMAGWGTKGARIAQPKTGGAE